MNFKILEEYVIRCRAIGVKASWEGLNIYRLLYLLERGERHGRC